MWPWDNDGASHLGRVAEGIRINANIGTVVCAEHEQRWDAIGCDDIVEGVIVTHRCCYGNIKEGVFGHRTTSGVLGGIPELCMDL